MQTQLLTVNKKIPKLRFKDKNSKEFPEWEEKKLGEFGIIIAGLTYSPSDIHVNGVLVLRSSNIQKRQLTYLP